MGNQVSALWIIENFVAEFQILRNPLILVLDSSHLLGYILIVFLNSAICYFITAFVLL